MDLILLIRECELGNIMRTALKMLPILAWSVLLGIQSSHALALGTYQQSLEIVKDNSPELEEFNAAISIKAVSRAIVHNENGQREFEVTYLIENKGKTDIAHVHWLSVYLLENKIVYNKSSFTDFDGKPLKPKQYVRVSFKYPESDLPPFSVDIFDRLDLPISTLIVAKQLQFSDGRIIKIPSPTDKKVKK